MNSFIPNFNSIISLNNVLSSTFLLINLQQASVGFIQLEVAKNYVRNQDAANSGSLAF